MSKPAYRQAGIVHKTDRTNLGHYPNIYSSVVLAVSVVNPNIYNLMSEITIDTWRCSGCGTCVVMSPTIFKMNPDGEKAELIEVDPEINEDILMTAAFCPEKCIDIIK
jgi:ferredoxin